MVSYDGPLLESDVWHVELCHASDPDTPSKSF